MANYRITAAAAALCFGIGVLGFGGFAAEAGPRFWIAKKNHNLAKGSVHVFSPPRLARSSVPSDADLQAFDAAEDAETVKTFTVTTVRPSRRWFRRHRALGQRFLGFQRQYSGRRYTGFRKTYRLRRNVVEMSRGTITKGKDEVVITKSLIFPQPRGLRDFKPSPVVTIIRYD